MSITRPIRSGPASASLPSATCSRSRTTGASKKNGITVLNTPGTVDSKYRGEVCVLVINLGLVAVKINKGDRVAQVVPAEVPQLDVKIVDVLDVTDRGASGFESTGRA